MRRLMIVLAASAAFAASAVAPAHPATMPTARTVKRVSAVGAVFSHVPGVRPDLSSRHFCSASVIRSASHDLIMTAAHCIHGVRRIFDFAPGFHDGHAPDGLWRVVKVYYPGAWKRDRSRHADVAVLRLASRSGRRIQGVVGGRRVGVPHFARMTTVSGYPAGRDGRPITCTNHIYRTRGYPTFDCRGFVGGVSGGPFVQDGTIVGVVGGLHTGGCLAHTSYSSLFGAQVTTLVERAAANGAGDVNTATGTRSGC